MYIFILTLIRDVHEYTSDTTFFMDPLLQYKINVLYHSSIDVQQRSYRLYWLRWFCNKYGIQIKSTPKISSSERW